MFCENPECGNAKLIVLESRPGREKGTRRRRYECPLCLSRYKTIERIIYRPPYLYERTPNS
jgi:transcriptional regulator NrdR family protein